MLPLLRSFSVTSTTTTTTPTSPLLLLLLNNNNNYNSNSSINIRMKYSFSIRTPHTTLFDANITSSHRKKDKENIKVQLDQFFKEFVEKHKVKPIPNGVNSRTWNTLDPGKDYKSKRMWKFQFLNIASFHSPFSFIDINYSRSS